MHNNWYCLETNVFPYTARFKSLKKMKRDMKSVKRGMRFFINVRYSNIFQTIMVIKHFLYFRPKSHLIPKFDGEFVLTPLKWGLHHLFQWLARFSRLYAKHGHHKPFVASYELTKTHPHNDCYVTTKLWSPETCNQNFILNYTYSQFWRVALWSWQFKRNR